jgi:hypothetical protein
VVRNNGEPANDTWAVTSVTVHMPHDSWGLAQVARFSPKAQDAGNYLSQKCGLQSVGWEKERGIIAAFLAVQGGLADCPVCGADNLTPMPEASVVTECESPSLATVLRAQAKIQSQHLPVGEARNSNKMAPSSMCHFCHRLFLMLLCVPQIHVVET